MKNTENNKKRFRRYLDGFYTSEEVSQLLSHLSNPNNHELLNELSSDIWEEAAIQQPLTALEHARSLSIIKAY